MSYMQRPSQYQSQPPFQIPIQQHNFQPQQPPPAQQTSSSGMSLEDIVKSLATSTHVFQQKTKASIKTLEQQMAQLSTSVSKIESQGKLPPQTEKNPKHNVCAITLKSGEEELRSGEKEIVAEKDGKKTEVSKPLKNEVKFYPPPPFPERLRGTRKEREEQEIMETFQKIEVNIPLLESIKQVPRYAKFLKQLCTSKKKLKGTETVNVSENISAVLQKRLPPKCKDPGVFTVPYMEDDDKPNSSSILLGRPFLKTSRTKIDVYNGTLSMEFDGEVINFNIDDAIRYPSDVSSLNYIDVVEPLIDKGFELSNNDASVLVLNKSTDEVTSKERIEKFKLGEELTEIDKQNKERPKAQKLKLPIVGQRLLPFMVAPG
ncbi:uncharacterized protein LOC143602260 [Bidens hawaiensis]|uniref:uncharacterized protein LOC143602260 n=1 Tax=Bidens hawaiensis TaxID=980011 RepID=UPI00404997B7